MRYCSNNQGHGGGKLGRKFVHWQFKLRLEGYLLPLTTVVVRTRTMNAATGGLMRYSASYLVLGVQVRFHISRPLCHTRARAPGALPGSLQSVLSVPRISESKPQGGPGPHTESKAK